MARKDSVSDWDVTPTSNDNVGGINIAEGCAAANLNNAIRTVMAQVKAYSLTSEPGMAYATKNADYTALVADKNAFLRFSADAVFNLPAAATLTTGWHCWIMADGGNVTIDPDVSETVNGATTLVVEDGFAAFLICNGSVFFAITFASQDVADLKLDELQPYVVVASAATTDIGAAASQNVTVTGTTTITSFGTVAAGTVRNLTFSGALTLTHNATSLILPYGANIVTVAGESLRAVSLGSGNWRVTEYQKASLPTLTAGAGLASTGSIAGGNMVVSLDLYTGSSASQTTFPVGWEVMVYVDANISRNGLVIPALLSTDSSGYVTSANPDAGTSLAGTWRVQGGMYSSFNEYYKAMRVA